MIGFRFHLDFRRWVIKADKKEKKIQRIMQLNIKQEKARILTPILLRIFLHVIK